MSWFLIGILALLPTYLVRFAVLGIPTTLLELCIYAATAYGLALYGGHSVYRDRLRQRVQFLLPAALLFLGALIGVLVSPDQRLALGLLKGFIIDPILVYVLLLTFVGGRQEIMRLIRTVVVSGSIVATVGILQALILHESRALGIYRFDAASSPNYLAFVLAPLAPLVLVAIRRPWLRAVSLASLLAALMLTGSRAGLVAGIAGLGIALVLSSRQFWTQRTVQLACLSVLVLGLFGSWFVVRPDFGASPTTGGRITSSNNIRWQIWGATGELVRAHPVTGLGLGNYQRAFGILTEHRVNFAAYITPEARTPHNLAVGLWTDTGLLGLGAFFVGLVLVGRSLVVGLRRSQTRQLAAVLTGSWFVLLAHGLVDMPIWKNDLFILFWFLVALPGILNTERSEA